MFIYVSFEFWSLAIKIVLLLLFVSVQFVDWNFAQNISLHDAALHNFWNIFSYFI
jgi:hypothetical protein